jgi:hypothetical protein
MLGAKQEVSVSIIYQGIVNPRTNMSYARFIWDEPGDSGGSLKIETRTKTYPGEREKDRKDNAIKEAVRLACAFSHLTTSEGIVDQDA